MLAVNLPEKPQIHPRLTFVLNVAHHSNIISWLLHPDMKEIVTANNANKWPTAVRVTQGEHFKDTWGYFQVFLQRQKRLFEL